jgi:hypothetical protein
MIFGNYKIELNENYHVAHPESKFIYWNMEDCDEPIGNGKSVEECIGLIKETLIERVNEYDRTLDPNIFVDKEIEKMRELFNRQVQM